MVMSTYTTDIIYTVRSTVILQDRPLVSAWCLTDLTEGFTTQYDTHFTGRTEITPGGSMPELEGLIDTITGLKEPGFTETTDEWLPATTILEETMVLCEMTEGLEIPTKEYVLTGIQQLRERPLVQKEQGQLGPQTR